MANFAIFVLVGLAIGLEENTAHDIGAERAATAAAKVAKEITARLYRKLGKTNADKVGEAVARILADDEKLSGKLTETAALAAAIKRDAPVTAHIDAYIAGERPICPLALILQLFRQQLQEIRDEILEAIQHSVAASSENRLSEIGTLEPSADENTEPEEFEQGENPLDELKKNSSPVHEKEAREIENDGNNGKSEEDEEEEPEEEENGERGVKKRGSPVNAENDVENLSSEHGIFSNVDKNVNDLAHVMTRSNLYPPAPIHQLRGPDKRRLSQRSGRFRSRHT
ncbi:histone H3.v1 isoform X2 [Diachasma alloeum]|uniref:histone H3.v1 isoform X2 n=1 Tax=Diachasma alloeum TaxID=454923 RepID=UPI0007384167|nr:histone H3.v1 isoform X2 [Diachasma alloeum]